MRFRFGAFVLDVDGHRLTGADRSRHLTPKAFSLLTALVEARGAVVSRSHLHARLWPTGLVVEENLSNLVAELRDALGDQATDPVFIRATHRVGYTFIADVIELSDDPSTALEAQRWLEWDRRRFPLGSGVLLVGRDSDADVRLDASTVSRRHARLVVGESLVVLEDLESKNGTFRGENRVTAPVQLVDGDEIRFGDVCVTFHAPSADATTSLHIIAP